MLREHFHRFRLIFWPMLFLTVSIGLIFGLRHWASQPNATAAMRAELDRRYDNFQRALAESHEALLQLQERAATSEQTRDQLNELYALNQADLVQTQRALTAANEALRQTQDALRQMQADYKDLAEGRIHENSPRPVAEETAAWDQVVARAAAEKEFANKIEELRRLRQQAEAVHAAVSAARNYFDRLWQDYTDVRRSIAGIERAGGVRTAGMEPELANGDDFRVAKPQFGTEVVVGAAEDDTPPRLSPAVLQAWIADRTNARTAEIIAQNRRLTLINKTIDAVSKDYIRAQRELEQAQIMLRRSLDKGP